MSKFDVPEEIQQRFAVAAAKMVVKYNIPIPEIGEFMMEIVQIYNDYAANEIIKELNK